MIWQEKKKACVNWNSFDKLELNQKANNHKNSSRSKREKEKKLK